MQPEIKGDYPEEIKKRIADGVLMAKVLRLIPPSPLAKQDCEVEWFEDKKGFPDWKIKRISQ